MDVLLQSCDISWALNGKGTRDLTGWLINAVWLLQKQGPRKGNSILFYDPFKPFCIGVSNQLHLVEILECKLHFKWHKLATASNKPDLVGYVKDSSCASLQSEPLRVLPVRHHLSIWAEERALIRFIWGQEWVPPPPPSCQNFFLAHLLRNSHVQRDKCPERKNPFKLLASALNIELWVCKEHVSMWSNGERTLRCRQACVTHNCILRVIVRVWNKEGGWPVLHIEGSRSSLGNAVGGVLKTAMKMVTQIFWIYIEKWVGIIIFYLL